MGCKNPMNNGTNASYKLTTNGKGWITGYTGNLPDNLVIPNKIGDELIRRIENEAFKDCDSLKSVDFSNCTKLKEISSYAFENCTSLTSIDFSNCTEVKVIGMDTFKNCTALTSIDLSKCTKLEEIYSWAFSNCTALTSVDLSKCTKLKKFGNGVFSNCSKLTNIDLSNCTKLTKIYSGVFAGCTKAIVTLPNADIDINGAVFGKKRDYYGDCTWVKEVHLPTPDTYNLREKVRKSCGDKEDEYFPKDRIFPKEE